MVPSSVLEPREDSGLGMLRRPRADVPTYLSREAPPFGRICCPAGILRRIDRGGEPVFRRLRGGR